jgi:hypothetical protein
MAGMGRERSVGSSRGPGRARRRTVLAFLASAPVAVAAAPASATDATTVTAPRATQALAEALHVTPGATCVQATILAQEIASWLGSDAIAAGLRIDVTGSAEDPRTIAFQMMRGNEVLAIRRFSPGPETCEHLEAAVGLAVALVVRASLLDEVTGVVRPVPKPVPPASPAWALTASAIVALGVVPGTAFGIATQIERAFPPNLGLRIGVLAIASVDNGFDHVAGTFDASVLALRLDACVRGDLTPRTHVQGCAGVLGGALGAAGQGFAASRGAWTAWGASATAAGIDLDLTPRWSLGGEVSLLVPFARTDVGVRLETGGVIDSRQIASAGGALSIGPVYRF